MFQVRTCLPPQIRLIITIFYEDSTILCLTSFSYKLFLVCQAYLLMTLKKTKQKGITTCIYSLQKDNGLQYNVYKAFSRIFILFQLYANKFQASFFAPPGKIRGFFIAEQILALALSPNMIRELKNMSLNFRQIKRKCFYVIEYSFNKIEYSFNIWIVRSVSSINLFPGNIRLKQFAYS